MKRTQVVGVGVTVLVVIVGVFCFAGNASTQGPEEPAVIQAGVVAGPNIPAAPSSTLFSYQGQLSNAAGAPITQAGLPMTFRLYPAASGGTACWSENRAVDVQNGLFSVLLGQTTALPSSCLAGDVYLELVVNGETLTPRERLASVAHAVEASTLPNGAATRGDLTVSGNAVVVGSNSMPGLSGEAKWSLTGKKPESVMYGHNLTGAFGATTQWNSDYVFTGLWDQGYNRKDAVVMWGDDPEDKFRFLAGGASEASPREIMTLDRNGNVGIGTSSPSSKLQVAGSITAVELALSSGGNVGGVGNVLGSGNQQIHMPGGDDMYINWHSGRNVHFGGGNEGADVSITPTGIDLHGNSITNCGALVEANLQTPQEIAAGHIARFEQGDLLCWSAARQELDLCSQASDPLVMAVADAEGRPIVIGAEAVKVVGPVAVGDYLVASAVPGYAAASRAPAFGIVIAQALESFDGDRGVIKAMIRKM